MKKVVCFVLLSAIIFATMEVALKISGSDVDPVQLTFIRFLLGGLVLAPFSLVEMHKNNMRPRARGVAYMALLGFVCVPVSMMFFQYGVMYSNAATAAVIFCVNPVFTAVFAILFGKGTRISPAKIVALLVALAGIAMMMRPWALQKGNTPLGLAFTFISAVLFGLYSVLGARSLGKMGTFTQTSMTFIIGALMLMVVLFVTGRPVVSGLIPNAFPVLYVGIIVTGGGYLFYFLAIRYADVTTGSVVFFLKPVFAPIVAVIVLGESISWNMYIGIALILVASFMIMRENRNAAKLQPGNGGDPQSHK
jgi:drug/metabolite transporter (DMT)-like permease